MTVLPMCKYVYYMCARCVQKPEEGFRSPELEPGMALRHNVATRLWSEALSKSKSTSTHC